MIHLGKNDTAYFYTECIFVTKQAEQMDPIIIWHCTRRQINFLLLC